MKSPFKLGDIVEIHYLPVSMAHFDKGIGMVTKVNHNTCQKGTELEWGYSITFIKSGKVGTANTHSWYHPINLKKLGEDKEAAIEFLTHGVAKVNF